MMASQEHEARGCTAKGWQKHKPLAGLQHSNPVLLGRLQADTLPAPVGAGRSFQQPAQKTVKEDQEGLDDDRDSFEPHHTSSVAHSGTNSAGAPSKWDIVAPWSPRPVWKAAAREREALGCTEGGWKKPRPVGDLQSDSPGSSSCLLQRESQETHNEDQASLDEFLDSFWVRRTSSYSSGADSTDGSRRADDFDSDVWNVS